MASMPDWNDGEVRLRRIACPPRRRSVIRNAAALLSAIAIVCLAACRTAPTNVLDSDIPAVPGLESSFARGLERRDGSLVGGRIVYRGRIESASQLLSRTVGLFSAAGWVVEDRELRDGSARATFAKGDRRCDLLISPSRIDPPMSSAQLTIRLAAPDESPAEPKA